MNYARIEVEARRMVRSFGRLPISLETLCSKFDIALYFTALKKYDAYYMTRRGKRIIVVNDGLIKSRQRFSIAHEFGHAVLGHGPIAFHSDGQRPHWQETQANVFAAEILMPKPILVKYGYLTPRQIADLCDVSMQAATIRSEQLGWMQCELPF